MAALRTVLSVGDGGFHRELTAQDRDELLRLRTLQELPKARYASKVAMTALPARRGRKVVYSHVDLYKMVEKVATDLRENGVRPNTVCCIALPNCVEAVVYFLAVVWIGAVAAPVDIELGEMDFVRAVKAAKTATIVSPLVDVDGMEDDVLFTKCSKAAKELELVEWHVHRTLNAGVLLETHGRRAASGAAWAGGAGDYKADSAQIAVHHVSVHEDVQALVVPLTHQNFCAAIRMFASTYDVGSDDTTVLVHPWYTMDGLLAILATIYSGGHLVVPAASALPDAEFASLCAQHRVDWFTGTPKFLDDLRTATREEEGILKDCHFSFIRSVAGGIDEVVLDDMENAFNAPVLEAYGTPETCGVATCNVEIEFKPGTKGTPAPDCLVVVFDPYSMVPVAPGVRGMIGVAGANVAAGYLDNDEVNEKTVITHTNDDGVEIAFFLTGDKGVLDEEGYLHVEDSVVRGRAETFAIEAREHQLREQEEALRRERQLAEEKEQAEKEAADAALREAEEKERREKEAAEEEARREEEKEKREKEMAEEQARLQEAEAAAEEQARIEREEAAERMLVAREEEIAARGISVKRSEDFGTSSSGSTAFADMATSSAVVVSSRSATLPPTKSDTSSYMDCSPRGITETTGEKSGWQTRKCGEEEALAEIVERLERIETNQRRLETEVEAAHRAEMASMRALLDETRAKMEECAAKQPMAVNMDDVNSAIYKATTAAHDSQLRTDAAVKAANEATAAAAEATKAARGAAVVEVRDVSKFNKTTLVSLDEVETAVRLHPSVDRARAFGRPDRKHGMEVFCAIAPKPGARVSEPWLKLHAQSVLPAACVPRRFYYVEDLQEEHSRGELAEHPKLQRVSAITGYTSSKIIKSPTWMPRRS